MKLNLFLVLKGTELEGFKNSKSETSKKLGRSKPIKLVPLFDMLKFVFCMLIVLLLVKIINY